MLKYKTYIRLNKLYKPTLRRKDFLDYLYKKCTKILPIFETKICMFSKRVALHVVEWALQDEIFDLSVRQLCTAKFLFRHSLCCTVTSRWLDSDSVVALVNCWQHGDCTVISSSVTVVPAVSNGGYIVTVQSPCSHSALVYWWNRNCAFWQPMRYIRRLFFSTFISVLNPLIYYCNFTKFLNRVHFIKSLKSFMT